MEHEKISQREAADNAPAEGAPPKEPAWKRALNALSYAVIIVGIVFGLPKLLVWSLQTQYPMAAITSGSMWPALKQGDLVFVQGVVKADLAAGDIVVYKNKANATFTIHRVVKINDDTFVTKGDANFTEDAPASYADLVGKNLTIFGKPARIPYLGYITMLASAVNINNGSKTQ